MKEITRIHIAKISYDAEILAKKELETYLKVLESYGTDTDIINDIEIRITEILSERGVKKGGVITEADVAALKEQLGDPSEFMGDGDMAVGPEDEAYENNTVRKLYRNIDNAIFGGVLSGVAAFFNVSPLVIRLLFIIVALASFGTAILVYIVLWIAVPPAKTAADKLQMTGQPVTVGSIRRMNETEALKPVSKSGERRRIGIIFAGVMAVIGAVIAAIITVVGAFAMILSGRQMLFGVVVNSTPLLAAYILAIISGVLLVAMFVLLAYAAFTQKMTRRVVISICVVVVLGLASFGTAVGLAHVGGSQLNQAIEANTHETAVALPADTATATEVEVAAKHIQVKYIVSSTERKATLTAFAKDTSAMPKVTTELQEGTLKIHADTTSNSMCTDMWGCGPEPVLTVYGPALTKLTSNEESSLEYQPTNQPTLMIDAQKNASVTISSGTIDTINGEVGEGAELIASRGAIAHVTLLIKSSASVELGSIQTVALTDQKACPAHTQSRINVWKMSDNSMMVNGTSLPTKSMKTECTNVIIESEEK